MKKSNSKSYNKLEASLLITFLVVVIISGFLTFRVNAQDISKETLAVIYRDENTLIQLGIGDDVDYSRMKNITCLNINGDSLNMIPAGIFKISRLEELNINSNQISTIPRDIKKLYNLRILNLANTSVQELPEQIRQLLRLQELHLPYTYWVFRLNELKKITRAKIILE